MKENLVESSYDWPGLHTARHLAFGTRLVGGWFDGTRYADKRAAEAKPSPVNRGDYERDVELKLDVLPMWVELSEAERQRQVREMVDGIVEEGKKSRGEKARGYWAGERCGR